MLLSLQTFLSFKTAQSYYFRGDCVLVGKKKFVSCLGIFLLLYVKKCHEKPMEMEFIMLIPSLKKLPCCRPFVVNEMSSNGMCSMLCRLQNAAAVGLCCVSYMRAGEVWEGLELGASPSVNTANQSAKNLPPYKEFASAYL